MATTTQPEILPPVAKVKSRQGPYAGKVFDDERLDVLSHLLDDFLRVPGTPIRFGLDGIVGFIPGIGDVLGGIASSIIIIAAWMRGVPAVTVARMVINVAIETAGGSLPIVGNLFDIAWKANRRNYKLLTESLVQPKRSSTSSWLVLATVCLVLAGLMLVPTLLLGWLLLHAGQWMAHLRHG